MTDQLIDTVHHDRSINRHSAPWPIN